VSDLSTVVRRMGGQSYSERANQPDPCSFMRKE
jgi:hypothetical protein